jgi:hypothetical protein
MKKLLLIIFSNFISLIVIAQQTTENSIEMADAMRASGKIYVVVTVLCVILTGLIIYLIQLDRKILRLEREVNTKVKK